MNYFDIIKNVTNKTLPEQIFLFKNAIDANIVVDMIKQIEKTYPFEKVNRRPHLTMEFPVFFDKRDDKNSVYLREIIYFFMMPPISQYFDKNNLSGMYAKKDFITISKLEPPHGMGEHRDNEYKDSNHFICMMYINDDYTGGEIVFPELGFEYKPSAGDILIYRGNLLHSVNPVVSGSRYTIGYGLTDDIT